jgi:hypothetical protein
MQFFSVPLRVLSVELAIGLLLSFLSISSLALVYLLPFLGCSFLFYLYLVTVMSVNITLFYFHISIIYCCYLILLCKTLLKKDAEVTYFSSANNPSLGITNIFQIGIAPTEMVLEVKAGNEGSKKQTA